MNLTAEKPERSTVVVANQKGGVGKTSIICGISAMLSQEREVILIDADPQGSLTSWCISQLPKDPAIEAWSRLKSNNLMTCLRGEAVAKSILNISENTRGSLKIIGANLELSKARVEFGEGVGAERMLKGIIEDVRINHPNSTIIIDTAGELSLVSNMAIAAATKLIIPVATQLMSIDALGLSLQRIGQIQANLNSGLREIWILPSLFLRQRVAHKTALNILENDFADLMMKSRKGQRIVIEDRAEMEKFLHAHVPFKAGSVIERNFKYIVELI